MKHHGSGPSKKLAPSRDADVRCPHTYSDDEGFQLEIDCSSCAGAQDIGNSSCAKGILNILKVGIDPDAIILKRYIHQRYRSASFRWLCAVAREFSALNRIVCSPGEPSDRRCQTCSASKQRTAEFLIEQIRHDPVQYSKDKTLMSDKLEGFAAEAACSKGHDCVIDSISILGSRDSGGF